MKLRTNIRSPRIFWTVSFKGKGSSEYLLCKMQELVVYEPEASYQQLFLPLAQALLFLHWGAAAWAQDTWSCSGRLGWCDVGSQSGWLQGSGHDVTAQGSLWAVQRVWSAPTLPSSEHLWLTHFFLLCGIFYYSWSFFFFFRNKLKQSSFTILWSCCFWSETEILLHAPPVWKSVRYIDTTL